MGCFSFRNSIDATVGNAEHGTSPSEIYVLNARAIVSVSQEFIFVMYLSAQGQNSVDQKQKGQLGDGDTSISR